MLKLCSILLLFLPFCQFAGENDNIIQELFFKQFQDSKCELKITSIGSGFTNKNYKVFYNDVIYFVRIGNENPKSLGIDRVREFFFRSLIEKENIAPKMIYFDSKTGNLILPFITGSDYGKVYGKWYMIKKNQ